MSDEIGKVSETLPTRRILRKHNEDSDAESARLIKDERIKEIGLSVVEGVKGDEKADSSPRIRSTAVPVGPKGDVVIMGVETPRTLPDNVVPFPKGNKGSSA